MNAERFVQIIKELCQKKGEAPTVVCKNAGVGSSFISDVNRGQTPSVAKVQMLAEYLGVTTSRLLGETEKPEAVEGPGLSEGEELLIQLFRMLPQEEKDAVLRVVQAAAGK